MHSNKRDIQQCYNNSVKNSASKAKRLLLAISLIAIVSGCASVPRNPLLTAAPENDFQYKEVSKQWEKFSGQPVRWGGEILKIERSDSSARITAIDFPLLENGKPDYQAKRGDDRGRFYIDIDLSNKDGALRLRRNQIITVAGTLVAAESLTLKESKYTVPVIESEAIERWPSIDRYYASRFNAYWSSHPYAFGYYGYYPHKFHRHRYAFRSPFYYYKQKNRKH